MANTSVQHPKSRIPTFLGGIALFFLFAAIVVTMLNLHGPVDDPDVTRGVERLANREKLNAEEKTLLNSYGVVNAANAVYHIPLDRAVEITINELKDKPVKASASPVPPVLPAGPQPPFLTKKATP
jgi:hypothetical protein